MKFSIALTALVLLAAPAGAEQGVIETLKRAYEAQETRTWHLFTLTDKGVINLLHGLTKRECEFALHRAKGEPATDEEIAAEKKASAERVAAAEKRYAELVEAHPICGNKKNWFELPKADQQEWFNYCGSSGSQGATYAGSRFYFERAECFE